MPQVNIEDQLQPLFLMAARPMDDPALESNVQIGDFRIERRIGAGGMGIVYQARQHSLNRPVALKVLGGEPIRVAGDLTC